LDRVSGFPQPLVENSVTVPGTVSHLFFERPSPAMTVPFDCIMCSW